MITDSDYDDQFCFPPRRPHPDPLIEELQAIAEKRMTPEAKLLLSMAIEAQRTGKMPNLERLKQP